MRPGERLRGGEPSQTYDRQFAEGLVMCGFVVKPPGPLVTLALGLAAPDAREFEEAASGLPRGTQACHTAAPTVKRRARGIGRAAKLTL